MMTIHRAQGRHFVDEIAHDASGNDILKQADGAGGLKKPMPQLGKSITRCFPLALAERLKFWRCVSILGKNPAQESCEKRIGLGRSALVRNYFAVHYSVAMKQTDGDTDGPYPAPPFANWRKDNVNIRRDEILAEELACARQQPVTARCNDTSAPYIS